jgi:hypothetical protein
VAAKALIAGVLVLVVLLATGWWGYEAFLAPEAGEPAEPNLAARFDALMEGGRRAELVGGVADEERYTDDRKSAALRAEAHVRADQAGAGGVVLDETGSAVPGARVEVCWHPRRAGDEAAQIERVIKTRRDGTFRVAIPEGESRRLCVIEQDERSADPMSASESHVVGSGGELVTLRVQRAPNLGGRYVDEEGKPLTYKRVLIFEGDYVKVTHAETNWEGRFEARVRPDLELVHVKVGKLMTDEPGTRTSALLGEINYEVPVGTRDLLLTGREPRYVTCTVRGSDGKAIRGAFIWAKRVGESVGSYVRLGRAVHEGRPPRITDAYRIGPLRPGEYSVFVDPRVSGYARSAEVRVRVPSPAIEVVCPATTGIRGTVRGEFRGKTTVVWWDAGDHPLGRRTGRARVNDDGTFHITGAANVAHRLFAYSLNGRSASLAGVMPGDEGIELKLEPGLSITGTVSDPELTRNGWVSASQGGIRVSGRCDELGRFEIKGLTAGDWNVHLYRLGFAADEQPRGVRVAAGTEGVRIGD